jgi:hypothetical protein
MFNYFHQNKFRYNEKGQLTPIFIVVIVILIIMAMVTVNLSKVSFIKTNTSNAADAGALAGGSVMANVFNAVAQASSQMEASYWEFFATTSALFVIALGLLISGKISLSLSVASAKAALAAGCAGVCVGTGLTALAALKEAIANNTITVMYVAVIMSIIISVTAYSIATYFHYLLIRDMAEEGRNSAVKIAQQFAFMNSGIGEQLKEGEIPDDADADQRRNYRETYEDWFDNIGEVEDITYAWKDGQDRNHYVRTRVSIDPVDTFKLKTTVLPWEAVVALLTLGTEVVIAFLYAAAAAVLKGSCACLSCCGGITAPVCCPCWAALCGIGMAMLAVGIAANILSIVEVLAVWQTLLIAWAGLLPGPVVRDSSGNMLWATICWIEDIDHNRKVRVDTWQSHQGANLGLWQTTYPETHSYSIVDFSGRGSIHPPKLRHDSSIVATDIIGQAEVPIDRYKDCPYATEAVAGMEGEISDLSTAAEEYDKEAEDLEEILRIYKEQGLDQTKIDEIAQRAEQAREMAENARQLAAGLEAQIDLVKSTYPLCF